MPFAAFAPIVGSVVAGLFSRKGAKDQNEAQIASAREQMAFQERMSNTAHQREVADLRAAGLNPILSATGGSGASSPSGAQANIENELAPAISSAMAARELSQNLRNMQRQEQVLAQQERKTRLEADAVGMNNEWLAEFGRELMKSNLEGVTLNNEATGFLNQLRENDSAMDSMTLRELFKGGDWRNIEIGHIRRLLQDLGGGAGSVRQMIGR